MLKATMHALGPPAYRERYQRNKQRLGKQRGVRVAQVNIARKLTEAIWHTPTSASPCAGSASARGRWNRRSLGQRGDHSVCQPDRSACYGRRSCCYRAAQPTPSREEGSSVSVNQVRAAGKAMTLGHLLELGDPLAGKGSVVFAVNVYLYPRGSRHP
jgi:hypothetical protein